MMACHVDKRCGIAAKDRVLPELGRQDVKQPGDRGHLKVLAAWRPYLGRPARRYARIHTRSIHPDRTLVLSSHASLNDYVVTRRRPRLPDSGATSRHDPKIINIQSLELQIRIKQITHCPHLAALPVSLGFTADVAA